MRTASGPRPRRTYPEARGERPPAWDRGPGRSLPPVPCSQLLYSQALVSTVTLSNCLDSSAQGSGRKPAGSGTLPVACHARWGLGKLALARQPPPALSSHECAPSYQCFDAASAIVVIVSL